MNKPIGQYLKDNINAGVIDFALRAELDDKGNVSFYIHPANVDGDTQDYHVGGEGDPANHVYNLATLKSLVAMCSEDRNAIDGLAQGATAVITAGRVRP